MHKGEEVLDLVGLDVANHVPPNVLGEPFGFPCELLHAVFPKIALSRVVSFLHIGVGLRLAHSHQNHVVAGLRGGFLDLGLNPLQTLRDAAHRFWNS